MGAFDNILLKHKGDTWLISLVCTVFVIYPNIAWYWCDCEHVAGGNNMAFFGFFVGRTLYYWATTYALISFNQHRLHTPSIVKRAGLNAGFVVLAFVVYGAIKRFTINYDQYVSITVFQFIVMGLMACLIGHIFVLYAQQRQAEHEIESLRIESLQSRCEALANQVNPHFFFNALNGLSSLIRKKDDERSLLYVSRLSEIFRYILLSDKKGAVTLAEELDFIEAFRHVMEVRFANKLSFAIDVPADKRHLHLPVLALLPLIENVTVHNMIDSEHRMTISIHLNEQNELVVSNPLYPKLTPPDTNGTGLKNVENRFKLMMNQQIRVERDDETFNVYLPLK